MTDSVPIAYGLLARALAESTNVDEVVNQLVRFAVQSLRTDFGGITLINPGKRFETVGATHPTVLQADALQYELGEGPCVDASLRSKSLSSSDLASDPRWPRWGPMASELGFRSVISAELNARGRRIGAINLYGDATTEFTAEDLETAQLFAYQGSLALSYARSEEGLRQAVDSRTLIGQAQGVLMERFGIGAEQAFAVLRRFSQENGTKLRDIATHVIEERELPTITDRLA